MSLVAIGESAREASHRLALASTEEKNKALRAMAKAIRKHRSTIIDANQNDMNSARQNNLSSALLDRLMLDDKRIESMAATLEMVAELADPVGRSLMKIERPNHLIIERVSVPIGVIAVIYESRPNVTVDAAGLCLKSGNAVILRGGSESFHSAQAIMTALEEGLKSTQLPSRAIQMIPTTDRSAVDELLKMTKYIDVIIPRGGMQLIEYIASQTQIPVFKHLAGVCHTYIHQAADKEMARNIVLNAKMRRTGICGATETLLVDEAVLNSHLLDILEDLIQAGCEVRGDAAVKGLNPRIRQANVEDFGHEFLEAIIAVKTVKDLSEAIAHIAKYSTHHTEAIITEDQNAAKRFLREVDSAIVMHNTSTQFADGGEFGMGAEIGIATGKLHARGPVGLEQLTTFKYLVHGNGQIRP